MSPHDDDWTTKLRVPKGAETPLDVLLPAYGHDDAAEARWERLRTEAPTRRLGRANALVARSLLAPDVAPEGESAAAAVELQATGWVAWVDRCLPGEGSLLHPPPRLHAQCELMRQWVFNTEEQVDMCVELERELGVPDWLMARVHKMRRWYLHPSVIYPLGQP